MQILTVISRRFCESSTHSQSKIPKSSQIPPKQQLLLNLSNNLFNNYCKISSSLFYWEIPSFNELQVPPEATQVEQAPRSLDSQSCVFNRKTIFPLLSLQPAENKNCHSKSLGRPICCQAAVRAGCTQGKAEVDKCRFPTIAFAGKSLSFPRDPKRGIVPLPFSWAKALLQPGASSSS